MKEKLTRRAFVHTAAAGSVILAGLKAKKVAASTSDKPALLGGKPTCQGGWPRWPEWRRSWEPKIMEILRSGSWFRGSGGGSIAEFETGYAELLGAKRCLAMAYRISPTRETKQRLAGLLRKIHRIQQAADACIVPFQQRSYMGMIVALFMHQSIQPPQ